MSFYSASSMTVKGVRPICNMRSVRQSHIPTSMSQAKKHMLIGSWQLGPPTQAPRLLCAQY